MSVPVRLTLFAGVLALVFGAAALLGHEAGPERSVAEAGHGEEEESGGGHAAEGAKATALPGLAAEQDGFRLRLEKAAGDEIAFRILDAEGRTVRDFEVEHEKRMHLIVVRRDLASFEHLHPVMDAEGVWRAKAKLRRAGTYRVFADFTVGGVQRTLGADRHVAGRFDPRALPAVRTTVRDDRGLDVRLRREGDRVSFDVLRDGRVVNAELEPYLGAQGHLVSLRVSDLAYLHNHPDSDALAFAVELPSSGTYRHYVQFQLDGRIHTAAFTEEVAR